MEQGFTSRRSRVRSRKVFRTSRLPLSHTRRVYSWWTRCLFRPSAHDVLIIQEIYRGTRHKDACISHCILVFRRHIVFLPFRFAFLLLRLLWVEIFERMFRFSGEQRGMKGNCSGNNKLFAPCQSIILGKVKRYVEKLHELMSATSRLLADGV